ncbi:MAG TPA: chromate efflux transporter [Candidatus Binataceae bacterium]|nr:chromate efflux transporter [Candidatus Binataceae bacterium]
MNSGRSALAELAPPFLRLGLTAFGGPAAHIAMMDEEFVRRRQWLTREEFLDMLGASNLVPGPSSTEMAIHIGHQRAGWRGLIVAGACFILPAMILVTACAWLYVTFGALPQIQGTLYGVKPVIIAVVLQALWGLAKTAIKNRFLGGIVLLAAIGALTGTNVLAILLAAGIAAAIKASADERGASRTASAVLAGKSMLAPGVLAAVSVPIGLTGLFLVFLKFGAVIFGSGYVLLAFLQADLVTRLHWLTQAQLLDAVAVGQVTPGPVFTTATFIGYLLGGIPGAIGATVGIFLPGFLFVAASRPLIPRIRNSKVAGAFLDGVNAGAVALMIAVTWQLGRAAIVDPVTAGIAAMSAAILFRYRINSAWLIGAGAIAGFIVTG